jgi:hypothetical protein
MEEMAINMTITEDPEIHLSKVPVNELLLSRKFEKMLEMQEQEFEKNMGTEASKALD